MKKILLGLALLLLAGTAVFAFSTVFGSRSALTISPEHLDFGDVPAGESERRVVAVTNTSDETVAIQRIEASTPFRVSLGSLSLGPRQSQVVMVRFKPGGSGGSEGQLTFESSALAGGTRSVKLEGHSHLPAEIAVKPLFVSFGEVRIGEVGAASITVANHGETELELTSLAIGRPFRAEVESTTVAAGASRNLELYFEPTAARDYDRSLTISSNDPERRRVLVSMDGAGVDHAPAPRIQVSPPNLEFGSVRLGGSQTRRVAIRNSGEDPLTLTTLLAPAHFAVPNRSRQLQPGEEVVLPVSFSPGGEGTARGVLRIYSNDPEQRLLEVSLSGLGQTRAVAGAGSEVTLAGGRGTGEVAGSRGASEVLGGPWATSNPGGDATAGVIGNGEAASVVAAEQGAQERATPEEGQESAAEEQLTAIAPNPTLEGGEVRLKSYRALLSAIHADSVSYDAASGAFAITGLHLPTVDAALGEYFYFDTTAAVGRFDSYGEAVVTLPVRMRDFRGNHFDMMVELTTGVSSTIVDGTLVSLPGSARSADGRAKLVGVTQFPDRSPFGGDAMRLSLDVYLK